jgi:Icc-related predicted phosphoesterase
MNITIASRRLSRVGEAIRVVLLSDTHEYHRNVIVPDGDLLIHAGDITRLSFSSRSVLDFDEWLGSLPHRQKVVIPGNHDFSLADPSWQKLITSGVLLINDGVEIMGFKIWGTPITPVDHGHFGGAEPADRAAQFRRIPDNTDLLVSHGPPYGVLDRDLGSASSQGCQELLAAVKRVRPRLHVFGHIHGGYGTVQADRTMFVNAAVAGRNGRPVNEPHLLHLRKVAQ